MLCYNNNYQLETVLCVILQDSEILHHCFQYKVWHQKGFE